MKLLGNSYLLTVLCLFMASVFVPSCVSIKPVNAQSVSIKDFGAKGNGIANDTEAFVKAAKYINSKGGNTILTIPDGNYIIGRQTVQNSNGGMKKIPQENIFELRNCNNVKINATTKAKIKYADGLKFGAFNPFTLKKHGSTSNFGDKNYAVNIGVFIHLSNCNYIEINNLQCDGNNQKAIYGGAWGDKGIQLWHYGIWINNTNNLKINNVNMHHFCLDGMSIANADNKPNNVEIMNSHFDYNGRQGLSWIGGNGLQVSNTTFNHTGKAGVASAPGAGLDIEAHGNTTVTNGYFKSCTFTNSYGAGLVADGGKTSNQTFEDCTFWGVTNWAVWVRDRNYEFRRCNIYGGFTHGHITTNWADATRFIECNFEDKSYGEEPPHSEYLTNIQGVHAMLFDGCTFTSNQNKNVYIVSIGSVVQPLFKNCIFNIKSTELPARSDYAKIVRCAFKNCTFNEIFRAKGGDYYLYQGSNIDQGGNNKALKYKDQY